MGIDMSDENFKIIVDTISKHHQIAYDKYNVLKNIKERYQYKDNIELKVGYRYVTKNMPAASVLVNEKYLYCASLNTNMLIKCDVESKQIMGIYYLPEQNIETWLVREIYR